MRLLLTSLLAGFIGCTSQSCTSSGKSTAPPSSNVAPHVEQEYVQEEQTPSSEQSTAAERCNAEELDELLETVVRLQDREMLLSIVPVAVGLACGLEDPERYFGGGAFGSGSGQAISQARWISEEGATVWEAGCPGGVRVYTALSTDASLIGSELRFLHEHCALEQHGWSIDEWLQMNSDDAIEAILLIGLLSGTDNERRERVLRLLYR